MSKSNINLQGFSGHGGGLGGGGSWYYAHGCALCNEGGAPNNRGASKKYKGTILNQHSPPPSST